jgi:hypothetical protein
MISLYRENHDKNTGEESEINNMINVEHKGLQYVRGNGKADRMK